MATFVLGTFLSHHSGVAVITLIWSLLRVPGAIGQCAPLGTTPGIREIVLGECFRYHNLYPEEVCEKGISKNCTQLADLFMSAFAFQPTCNVTFSRYDEFIRAAHIDVPSGQSMFWSDVYSTVERYSNRGQRTRPIADTLIGYFGHGIRFCAQEADPGVIYGQECASYDQTENCSYNAEFSFWAMASKNFASTASGEAKVMLNASLTEAFFDTSFFATWEVPNMNPSKLTKLTILLVHIPGQEIRSTCSSDNIAKLQKILREKNMTSDCHESPRDVQTMLCTDYTDAEECKKETTSVSTSVHADSTLPYLIWLVIFHLIH